MMFTTSHGRFRRAPEAALAAFLLTFALSAHLAAQAPTPAPTHAPTQASAPPAARDTTSRRDSARSLERVMISAVRDPAAPISQKTLTRPDLQRQYFGQDVPLVLRGSTPSLTSYAETGNYWGYSYIRLRGIDQSRINITLDGIPLNDPEDQVLYFADFPDLTGSLQSIQVQRGVGTSTNGTASFAGSINMETTSLAATSRGGAAQIEGGSFGSRRGSLEFNTGLMSNGFAISARASTLHTQGYRYHSGVDGQSGYLGAGYFGQHDILKLTLVAGAMQDTMAYLAVPVSQLDTNRRINPLSPSERDGFGERLASLSYTH
ncbi:MAG: TonB-dependent receptor plug domain-containing protein, partial [Gemmatimonadota bacterium]|nr:TonB-dependent receptor plug domain-containing protein [Gemmatimonadota bacterium]